MVRHWEGQSQKKTTEGHQSQGEKIEKDCSEGEGRGNWKGEGKLFAPSEETEQLANERVERSLLAKLTC